MKDIRNKQYQKQKRQYQKQWHAYRNGSNHGNQRHQSKGNRNDQMNQTLMLKKANLRQVFLQNFAPLLFTSSPFVAQKAVHIHTISYNSFFHMFYTVLLSFAVNSFHRPAYYLLYYSTILQFHHNTFLYSKNRQHQKDYTSFRTACLLHVINKTAILFTYYKYKFQHYICFQNYRKYRIRHFP